MRIPGQRQAADPAELEAGIDHEVDAFRLVPLEVREESRDAGTGFTQGTTDPDYTGEADRIAEYVAGIQRLLAGRCVDLVGDLDVIVIE